MTDHRPLTVICDSFNWDALNEAHFLTDILLSAVRRPIRYKVLAPNCRLEVQDDVLIFNLGNALDDVVHLFLESGCQNVGMVEWCHSDQTSHRYSWDVNYVLTPFYEAFKRYPAGSPVTWIPVGYKTGIGPRNPGLLQPFSQRPTQMFFAGVADTPDRQAMLSAFYSADLPGNIITTEQFNGVGGGVGVNLYRTYMEQARFALIPRGSAADAETMRLYEAMELGAIPITLRHEYVEEILPVGCPIVKLDDWSQLPEFYDGIFPNEWVMAEWDLRQKHVLSWWGNLRISAAVSVSTAIEASFQKNSRKEVVNE